MTKAWLVLKFGGTSVSGPQQWQTIASLEMAASGMKVVHSRSETTTTFAFNRIFGPGWQEIQH